MEVVGVFLAALSLSCSIALLLFASFTMRKRDYDEAFKHFCMSIFFMVFAFLIAANVGHMAGWIE